MLKTLTKISVSLTIGFSLVFPVQASPKLKVGIYLSPPFVVENNTLSIQNSPSEQTTSSKPANSQEYVRAQTYAKKTVYDGISIEIWQQVAVLENLEYEYVLQENIEQGVDGIVNGEIDLLMGEIPFTAELLQKVSFSQPYYLSPPALLVEHYHPTFWDLVHPFLRVAAISTILGLLLIHLIFAHLIWFAERNHNEHFPQDYWEGIREASWFALVTMTTVGYGDRVPITHLGRLLTFIWMWFSMVAVSSITAGLATTFTLSLSQQTNQSISKPEDLKGLKVATVNEIYLINIAKEYQVIPVETSSIEQAMNLLLLNKVNAVLASQDSLKYYKENSSNSYFHNALIIPIYNYELTYGFILPKNSNLDEKINLVILQMQADKQIQTIISRWNSQ